MNLERLLYLGFDESSLDDEEGSTYLRVACSCCAALVINGTPCHERGCSNQSRECPECGCDIPSGAQCDCMDDTYPECEAEFAGSAA